MALAYAYRGHVDGNPGSDSATSGPIPVLAGDVLAVTVNADSFSGTTAFCTVTVSTGWGFTERVDYDPGVGGYAGAFALVCAATTSPTITVTITGAAAGHRRPSFDIWTITGADTAGDLVIQTATGGTVSNPGNILFTSANSRGHTLALIAGTDPLHKGPPYVSGDGVNPGYGFSQSGSAGPPGVSGFGSCVSWAAPNTTYTTVVDPPGSTGDPFIVAMMEFGPAPEPPTVDAGPDRNVERTKSVTRTAGETANGATVTAREWKIMSGPVGAGTVTSTTKATELPKSTAGVYVIRYTATNSAGTSYDEATITVTPLRPVVDAGPDEAIALAQTVTRTASEVAGDDTITSRQWRIESGPDGVGTTIGTSAALSWTPTVLGTYVIRYVATSSAGTSDPSYATVTVGVAGVELHIPGAPKIGVSIAFGGDLTDPDGSDWVFTEVTPLVRVADGVHMRHGRADEASVSQPASCSFVLDNRDGRFSLGGRSPYWPNVRQGVPVKVEIDNGSGWSTEFLGYADGFTPSYSQVPLTGDRGDAVVTVSASGVLRRMAQGRPAVVSPMRSGLLAAGHLMAYWPCEDGKDATEIASALPGHPPMTFSSRLHGGANPWLPPKAPAFQASTVFQASLPLPKINDSEWYGDVPAYPTTNRIQVQCLLDMPESGSNNDSVLLGVITSGDPSFWEIRYSGQHDNGWLNVRAWRNFSTLPVDTYINFDLKGKRGLLALLLEPDGGGVKWTLRMLVEGYDAAGGYVATLGSSTVGRVLRVQTATDGGHMDVTLGHIAVRDVLTSHNELNQHLNGWTNEIVGERLLRTATDNLLPYTQPDGLVHFVAVTDRMGRARIGTPLEILRDCEAVDQGILWDGVHPGVTYSTKRYRESRAPAMVLNAAAGQVAMPFAPTHDDSGRVNRALVTRTGGVTAEWIDETGPLGRRIIGDYSDSLDVNVSVDAAAVQYAGWLVHQGTIEGYRWPRLSLDLARNSELRDAWLALNLGDRVDVAGVGAVNLSAPAETISLAVEGYEQTITDSSWRVQLNTSLYRRWAVACAGDTSGSAAEFEARADTDSSEIAALVSAGQTTLSVATLSGPLWTVDPADYPFQLDVGGVAVTAHSCSGSSSPQTFTVDAMPVTRPAGTKVQLWLPPVLGL